MKSHKTFINFSYSVFSYSVSWCTCMLIEIASVSLFRLPDKTGKKRVDMNYWRRLYREHCSGHGTWYSFTYYSFHCRFWDFSIESDMMYKSVMALPIFHNSFKFLLESKTCWLRVIGLASIINHSEKNLRFSYFHLWLSFILSQAEYQEITVPDKIMVNISRRQSQFHIYTVSSLVFKA